MTTTQERRRGAPRVTDASRTQHGVSPQRHRERGDLAPVSPTGSHPNYFYHGGPVINTPQVYCVFAGNWSSTANQTRAGRLSQFLTDLVSSRYMNILSQYGCGTTGNVIKSVFVGVPNNNLTDAQIHSILQNAINNNTLPEPTNHSNLYVVFLDDATGVNDTSVGIVMCEKTSDDAFGYHDFFTTTAGNACVYGVIPGLTDTCLKESCSDDGTCSLHLGQTREQRQTQVTSHEFSEAISDPQLNAWVDTDPADANESENGDICNGESGSITVGANTWNVQRMYSKWHDMNTSGATTCLVDSDPLPSLLPACSIIVDRSTFGKDEVDALLTLSNPAQVEAAFYVAIDGFTPAQLGITGASLIGTPNVAPNVTLTPGVAGMSVEPTSLVAEDPSLGGGIQRFTWVYRVDFTSSAGFPSTVGATSNVLVDATMSTVTAPTLNVSGSAVIQLIHEPNPYELDGAVSWLSTDLRVFQINAGDSRLGVTMGSDAPAFVQQIVNNLNTGATGGQTFDDLPTDEQVSHLELSEAVNGTNVYNFAVAKVRYRALSSDAVNVRTFFRLFPVSTTSTDYNLSTSYRRGGQNGVEIPLLGIQSGEISSIPCFAAARLDTSAHNLNEQTDPTNLRTIVHDGTGQEVAAYFGCWLDINQSAEPLFPLTPSPVDGPFASGRLTIQQLIRNTHQCLVAEIAFDPDPIPAGASPGSSDKLAQRNLSIVESDNPGGPASHLIPNTFEVRLTTPKQPAGVLPDELLFDWRALPHGSDATLYVPGASAKQIVQQATELYTAHRLQAVDDQTIRIPADGLTYVPVPEGTGANLPGLLTVQLPSSVRKGQLFKVVVRQVTNAALRVPPPPPPPPRINAGPRGNGFAAEQGNPIRWRRILGSYEVSIPVSTHVVLLPEEERRLSVLRWVQEAIPSDDRWYLVFNRYVDQIADRVRGLGGDPGQIEPSPRGDGKRRHHVKEHVITGKIDEVIFDHFGDFEGFVMDTGTEHPRRFHSREPGIARLVLEAAQRRWLVSAYVDRDKDNLRKIVLRW